MTVEIEGKTLYRSSEVSKLTGVSKSTIHHWIKVGIVTGATYRDRNGWMLFTEEDVESIKSEAGIIRTDG